MVGGRVVAPHIVDMNMRPSGDVRGSRADGRSVLMIFSPAAIARRESLCPIGRSAGILTRASSTRTVSPPRIREVATRTLSASSRRRRRRSVSRPVGVDFIGGIGLPGPAPRAVPKNYRRSGVIRRAKKLYSLHLTTGLVSSWQCVGESSGRFAVARTSSDAANLNNQVADAHVRQQNSTGR